MGKKCSTRITSYKRSKEKNKRVGGAKNSYHLYGRALDVVVKPKFCKKLFINLAMEHDLSVIIYTSHVHVDNRIGKVCLKHRRNNKGKNTYYYCKNK